MHQYSSQQLKARRRGMPRHERLCQVIQNPEHRSPSYSATSRQSNRGLRTSHLSYSPRPFADCASIRAYIFLTYPGTACGPPPAFLVSTSILSLGCCLPHSLALTTALLEGARKPSSSSPGLCAVSAKSPLRPHLLSGPRRDSPSHTDTSNLKGLRAKSNRGRKAIVASSQRPTRLMHDPPTRPAAPGTVLECPLTWTAY